MVPIITDGKKGFNTESLKRYILETCKNHKIERRALAFAFIIYDFEGHTIPKILKDETYWSSLDKISGQHLTIFYLNSKDSYYKRRQKEIHKEYQQNVNRNIPDNAIACLIPMNIKIDTTDNGTQKLKQIFSIEENIKTPMVIFFQIDEEDNISDSFIVGLKKEKLEDAFLELRNHIQKAVKSIDRVLPENYDNHQAIFNLIKAEIKSGLFYTFFNEKIANKLTPATLISIVKLFLGGA